MTKRTAKSLILVLSLFLVALVTNRVALAKECDPNYYGGGEICNKSFRVTKEVRVEDEDDDWKDKVYNVAEDDVVEFRITVENVGEVTVDDMKYEDFLPDEMEKVGGSGLTEYWDDFEPGDKKRFEIKAVIDEDEYDDENFEKCIVNKVEIEWDGNFEGSDTATVCYKGEETEITELPDTGPTSSITLAVFGFGLIGLGTLVKKRKLSA